MKIQVTIDASCSPMLAPVVRAILQKNTPDEWRQMIQERTPAGVRIDKITITQEP